jgi:hypothetical protein
MRSRPNPSSYFALLFTLLLLHINFTFNCVYKSPTIFIPVKTTVRISTPKHRRKSSVLTGINNLIPQCDFFSYLSEAKPAPIRGYRQSPPIIDVCTPRWTVCLPVTELPSGGDIRGVSSECKTAWLILIIDSIDFVQLGMHVLSR